MTQQLSTAEGPREKVHNLLEAVTEKVLRPYHYDEFCDAAQKKLNSRPQQHTVVVVGEVGRGKSALANALVGVKGASPEGVDFTTATAVALGLQTDDLPAGYVRLFQSDGGQTISHEELNEWVSGAGQQRLLKTKEEVPTRAFVALPHSTMGDVIVIDTPGVGGLDAAHAKLAHSSAEQASVLVIAVDSSTPITAPEMDFIKSAGSHLDAVVVAVTKIDKNLTRWEQIVAKNIELIRQHTGRDIPVIGVSSLLATYANPALDEDELHAMRELSHIEGLRAEIQRCFANAESLPMMNALRIGVEGLRRLREDLRGQLTAALEGPAALPGLNDELERLETLKKETEQWEQFLQLELLQVRQTAVEALELDLNRIRDEWTETVGKQGMAVLRKNPQHFTAQMEADFQGAVLNALDLFTRNLHEDVIEPRFESQTVWEEIQQELVKAFSDREIHTGTIRKKTEGVFDPMMLMMGLSGGSAITGLLATAAVSFTGIGAVIGVSWVAFNVGFRSMKTGKNNLIAWLRETANTTKIFANRLFDTATASVRPIIVIRHREQLKSQIQATQDKIKEATKASEFDQKRRAQNADRLRNNIAIIEKKIKEAEGLILELSNGKEV